MTSTSQSDMPVNEIKGTDGEPLNRLNFAAEYHRRKGQRARVSHDQYKATGNDMLMRFQDFKQQGIRNKIRREYGLEPTYLRGEGKPIAA